MTNVLRVASFFSGIGGFDLGLERSGMKIVFQCEVNEFCKKVLKKHWPHIPLESDILTLKADAIPDAELWVPNAKSCKGFQRVGRK